jgi:hypothetical protein
MVKAGFTIPLSKGLIVQPVIEYWFPLSAKAGKTMGYNSAGDRISYNPDGYVGHNVVAGMNVTYVFDAGVMHSARLTLPLHVAIIAT